MNKNLKREEREGWGASKAQRPLYLKHRGDTEALGSCDE